MTTKKPAAAKAAGAPKNKRAKPIAGPGGWTVDEAVAAQEAFEAAGGDPSDATGPVFQWGALIEVEELRAGVTADGSGLMNCIYLCAWHGVAMPRWLAREFMRRYRDVRQFRAASWDEVLGRPHPKGVQLAAARKRLDKTWRLRVAVQTAHLKEPKASLSSLIEREGDALGLERTQAFEFYHGVKGK